MSPLPISLDVSYSYDNNLFVLVSFPLFYRLFVEKEIVTSVEMQYSEKNPPRISPLLSPLRKQFLGGWLKQFSSGKEFKTNLCQGSESNFCKTMEPQKSLSGRWRGCDYPRVAFTGPPICPGGLQSDMGD